MPQQKKNLRQPQASQLNFEGQLYQFHQKSSYPCALYLANDLENLVSEQLKLTGWLAGAVTAEGKTSPPPETTLNLIVKVASPPIQALINTPAPHNLKGHLTGKESFFTQNAQSFYRYEKFGLMSYKENSYPWELAIVRPETMEDLKKLEIILYRFLALSLWSHQLLAFWGYLWEDGVMLTRPHEGDYNCFFIDLKNYQLLYRNEVKKIPSQLSIYINDKMVTREQKLQKEELLSALFTRTLSLPIGNEKSSENLRKLFYELLRFGQGKKTPQANKTIFSLSY